MREQAGDKTNAVGDRPVFLRVIQPRSSRRARRCRFRMRNRHVVGKRKKLRALRVSARKKKLRDRLIVALNHGWTRMSFKRGKGFLRNKKLLTIIQWALAYFRELNPCGSLQWHFFASHV